MSIDDPSPHDPDTAGASATEPAAIALLRFLARTDRLESLPRTGWLISGIPAPESIAAHSYSVALIAMWIADQLDEEVDTTRVLRMALLHDIGEAMLTDLPAPVKRFVGADVLREAEERAALHILADTPQPWRDAFLDYEARDTLEARIVKAADRVQMMVKALCYETQQRGDTRRFWGTERNFQDEGIPLVRDIFERLRALRDSGEWFESNLR